MLSIAGLTRRFGARTVVDDLALEVAAGELVAIVGESGAGKSTLLNLIAGLDTPQAGYVRIGAADIAALDEDARTQLRRTRVGFVFQAFHILPHLTVAQNVELPLVLIGTAPAQRAVRAQAMLDAVGLGARGASLPRELSGGELQRVALARALAHRPALLLADEPTGNLDPDTAARVLQVLVAAVKAEGAAGVLVTHSAHAAAVCDRTLVLERGRLRPR